MYKDFPLTNLPGPQLCRGENKSGNGYSVRQLTMETVMTTTTAAVLTFEELHCRLEQ